MTYSPEEPSGFKRLITSKTALIFLVCVFMVVYASLLTEVRSEGYERGYADGMTVDVSDETIRACVVLVHAGRLDPYAQYGFNTSEVDLLNVSE